MLNGKTLWLAASISVAALSAQASSFKVLCIIPHSPDPWGQIAYHKGVIYGSSYAGGEYEVGTVYQFDIKSRTFTTLAQLGHTRGNGTRPEGGVTYDHGYLFGTTDFDASLFRLDLKTGGYHTAVQFPNENLSYGVETTPLVLGRALFGTDGGGGGGYGALYEFDRPSKTYTVLHNFTGSDGIAPSGLTNVNGLLYGTTVDGGNLNLCDAFSEGCGTLFEYDISGGKFATIYTFQGAPDGAFPSQNPLMVGSIMYGLTEEGGASNNGTIFSFDTNTKIETVLYGFKGQPDGSRPEANLIYQNGVLYGVTALGGTSNVGTIFSFDLSTHSETTLHNFSYSDPGGANPNAIIWEDGAIYGVTGGGESAIFKFVP